MVDVFEGLISTLSQMLNTIIFISAMKIDGDLRTGVVG